MKTIQLHADIESVSSDPVRFIKVARCWAFERFVNPPPLLLSNRVPKLARGSFSASSNFGATGLMICVFIRRLAVARLTVDSAVCTVSKSAPVSASRCSSPRLCYARIRARESACLLFFNIRLDTTQPRSVSMQITLTRFN